MKVAGGHVHIVAEGNSRPAALNDSPGSHTFTLFCNARTWVDSSDREKCFIKHRILHLSIPNVDIT